MRQMYLVANLFVGLIFVSLILAIIEKHYGQALLSREIILACLLAYAVIWLITNGLAKGMVTEEFIESQAKLRFYIQSFVAIGAAAYIHLSS